MTVPFEFDSDAPIPDLVMGYVSVRSEGGTSVLDATDLGDAKPFRASAGDRREAAAALESVGLQVLAESALGVAVAGAPAAFEELTGGTVVARERLQHTSAGRERYVTHLDIVGARQPDDLGVGEAAGAGSIEAVLLERPRQPYALFPSPLPPRVTKFHLQVPDDVALLLGAHPAHRAGHVGGDVTVAMVDSGQFAHPYFVAHGYAVAPTVSVVPGASAAKDPVGHGTGESANIFAVAPGARLRAYRTSNNAGQLVAAIGGFLRAKGDNPDVLTNSWGGDGDYPPAGQPSSYEKAWAAEIRDAVEQGIVVVFSAGNGQFSIEPQVPGVIAAGGVYADPQLDLRASDYASAYASPWFPGVKVPTACGLVGLRPRAQYLMLPIPPGCEIDGEEAVAAAGDTPDGTGPADGWALFSGTSAAAPQLAGAAALVLGAKPGLTPAQVRDVLTATARDVTVGRCHPRFNHAAAPGPDLATGAGLIDAGAAVRRALTL